MAYRMNNLTKDVRAGINWRGDLHIEVQTRHPNGLYTGEVEDLLIPADAVGALFHIARDTDESPAGRDRNGLDGEAATAGVRQDIAHTQSHSPPPSNE